MFVAAAFITFVVTASYPQSEVRDAYLYTFVGIDLIVLALMIIFSPTVEYLINDYTRKENTTGRLIDYDTTYIDNTNSGSDDNRTKSSGESYYLFTPVYEYTVNGTVYREPAAESYREPPEQGAVETIYYSTKNPHLIWREVHKSGVSIAGIIFGIVLLVPGLFFFVTFAELTVFGGFLTAMKRFFGS